MKKISAAAFILAGVLTFSAGMSGCAWVTDPVKQESVSGVTKESLIEKAVRTFTEIRSLDMDLKTEMDLRIGTKGFELELKSESDAGIEDIMNGSSHFEGNIKLSALGLDNTIGFERYQEKEGEGTVDYTKLSVSGEEGIWIRSVYDGSTKSVQAAEEAGGIKQMSAVQLSDVYSRFKESIADLKLEEGTVSYNGTDCYLVSGNITGDKLAAILQATGQDISVQENDFSVIDMDVRLYFKADDETPYAAELDLEDTIRKIVSSQAESLSGMEIWADTVKLTLVFNEYDKLTDIKVPDEVKDNALDGIDSLNVQNLLMGV